MKVSAAMTLAVISMATPRVHAGECCRWALRMQPYAGSDDAINVEPWAHVPDSACAFASGGVHIRADQPEFVG